MDSLVQTPRSRLHAPQCARGSYGTLFCRRPGLVLQTLRPRAQMATHFLSPRGVLQESGEGRLGPSVRDRTCSRLWGLQSSHPGQIHLHAPGWSPRPMIRPEWHKALLTSVASAVIHTSQALRRLEVTQKGLLVKNKPLRVSLSSTNDDEVRFQSPRLDQLQ